MDTPNDPLPLRYTKDNCPDSLAWSNDLQICALECIFPVYSETELETLFIIDVTLASIGFILCYFYCITALLRPLSLKFPNNTIVFMIFSLLLQSIGLLFPLFLGRRYVFCDTNTELAKYNWACVLSSIFFHTGQFCFFQWTCLYHIAITCRLYFIHLPKVTPYIFFIIGFFGWNIWSLVIGFSLDYNVYVPGSITCEVQENKNYLYGSFISYFYMIALIILFCILLILVRMIRVKVKTGILWKIILFKQFRLFLFWSYILCFIIIQTIVIGYTTRIDTDEGMKEAEKYVFCVLAAGDDEDCELNVDPAPFSLSVISHLLVGGFAIITFLLFGLKEQTIQFWKEYISFCISNKTIPISFSPSFDPNSTVSQYSRNTTRTEETFSEETETEENETKQLIRLKSTIGIL